MSKKPHRPIILYPPPVVSSSPSASASRSPSPSASPSPSSSVSRSASRSVSPSSSVSNSPSPSSGGSLLTQSDFSYMGTVELPTNVPATGSRTADVSLGFGLSGYTQNSGLCHAVVSGTPYMFSTADGTGGGSGFMGEPYRFSVGSISTSAPYPLATINESYGYAYGGKRVDYADNPGYDQAYSGPGGLFVRNNGGTWEMWWAYPPWIYQNDNYGASLGYSTLNMGGGSATGVAAYKFSNVSFPFRSGSFIPIPASWQSSFGGHPMMLCNFGISSTHGSVGPWMMATDFPTGAHLSSMTTGYKEVIGYSLGRCTNNSSRPVRPSWLPALTYNHYDADPSDPCVPDNSYAWGLNNWTVFCEASQYVFIDTGSKYGVVSFNQWVLGGLSYTAAQISPAARTTGWGIIDPNDLADVYADLRGPDVPYAESFGVQYPGYDYNSWPMTPLTYPITAQSNATSDRVRVTFATPPAFVADNPAFFCYLSLTGTTYYDGGYKIAEQISPTVYDVCGGQNCGDIALSGPLVSGTAWIENSISRGRVVGATWMPTNPVVGTNNVLAVAMDYDGASQYTPIRRVHFYQVS